MTVDYVLSPEEAEGRADLEDLLCSSSCEHFDSLNQVCWVTWQGVHEGAICGLGLLLDEDGNHYRVLYPELEEKIIEA